MDEPFRKLDIEGLKAWFSYNPITGELTSRRAGRVVGTKRKEGYVVVNFRRAQYPAHRVAWAIFYGEDAEKFIDHKNLDKADNSIKNLRLATKSENLRNMGLTRRNKSGIKGVCFCNKDQKWQAQIRINGRTTYLGRFKTAEEAAAVYRAASLKVSPSFSRFS